MERNDEILYLRAKVAELKEQSKHKDKLLRDRKYEIRELNRKLSEATEQIRIDKTLIKKLLKVRSIRLQLSILPVIFYRENRAQRLMVIL